MATVVVDDPDVSLIFFTTSPPGIHRAQIKVDFKKEYNRKILSTHETNIDTIWCARCDKNPHLYNGSKFRFHSIQQENQNITFCLGLTGYKEYIGTNWADNAKELQERGKGDYGNTQAYMSDALGVGAFVQTSDDYVIFMRRSQQVGEAQGLWDIPGGHPEPEEVSGGAKKLEDINICNMSCDDVVMEIFDATKREIRDEINIPMTQLSEPCLIGVAINNTSSGRPSAEFFVKCSLSSKEVREQYNAGGAEAGESSGLRLISLKDIPTLETTEMWQEMAPSGKGCVRLYNAMMSGNR
ncbi:uridine diphosphate glucose pyrophosphatase NUDT22-like [Amphiura filiformis]|uniref:uridine diphosphate glucose pyrophosphatase NUDT22-like n=1 Tax=Amphiura filiformis TaxID=82378 RepID=UPI003B20D225